VGICSVGFEEAYRWKDSTQSLTKSACGRGWHRPGLPPWIVKFNAKPLDRRWFKPVEDLYVWHWKNEKYLRNERPLARVGLVSTSVGRAAPDDHASGFYHALVEARIPFEMLRESQLDPERLRPFQVLALPNIATSPTRSAPS